MLFPSKIKVKFLAIFFLQGRFQGHPCPLLSFTTLPLLPPFASLDIPGMPRLRGLGFLVLSDRSVWNACPTVINVANSFTF